MSAPAPTLPPVPASAEPQASVAEPGDRWLRLLPGRLRRDPLARALAALDPDPRRTLLAVLTGAAALGSAIGLMAVSGWLISRAAQRPPVLYLEVAAVATRTFGISRGVLRYVERLISHDVALRGVVVLRERLYRRLAGADPVLVAGLRRGDLLARVGADVDTLADLVVRSLLPFGVALVTTLAAALLVGLLLPPAGLVVAAGLLIAALVTPWLAAVAARRAEREAAQARADTSAEVLALLDGVAELTVAGAVPARLDRLAELDARLAHRLDRAAAPAAGAAGLATLATGLGMVGALALGVPAVASGALQPVLLAVITLTPLAAVEAITGLPAAATGLVRARTAAERVLQLLEAPPASTASVVPAAVPAGPSAEPSPSPEPRAGAGAGAPAPGTSTEPAPGDRTPRPRGLPRPHLHVDGLSCGWPGRPAVLTDFDLDLPPGRRVAVVGSSGGGKTTLLLTLAGLVPPASGRVELGWQPESGLPDSRDLAGIDPAVLRRTVSFTAEDSHVFTTTVRENLRVAIPDATDDELVEVLDRAGLGSWLEALPEGLDTMLGSGGTGLSGGERRRLLLARALLVGAGVLLLDEPAEHLDPQTADGLLRDVLGGRGEAGAAVVVVTHRLAPLDAADGVIVLEEGRVAARGGHRWLLDHYPPYREAWTREQGLAGVEATSAGPATPAPGQGRTGDPGPDPAVP